MATITDTAVCLRRWDFSETSQTVSLFTRQHGVVRGLAKGAKRERGRFSGGFDVLTRGQVIAIVKPNRELATLTDWSLEETYRVLRQRLDANRIGLLMADLMHHMLTEHDPHPTLFDTLVAALARLSDRTDAPRALLELQWRLLEETGYRPQLACDVETGAALPDENVLVFDPRLGGLVAHGPAPGRWRVRRTTVELLHRIDRGAADAGEPASVVRRANRLLAVYCRELIGADVPTLRWAFSDLERPRGGG